MKGDLFPKHHRLPPQKLMRVVDAAEGEGRLVKVRCKAGHEAVVACAALGERATHAEYTVTELRRGIPCQDCN